MTSRKKLERANAIHAHEQQVIAAMRDADTTIVHGLHDTTDEHAHELARIEEVGGKARYVCVCGEIGLAVGCAVFPGVEWATLAHAYHAMQSAEGEHVFA